MTRNIIQEQIENVLLHILSYKPTVFVIFEKHSSFVSTAYIYWSFKKCSQIIFFMFYVNKYILLCFFFFLKLCP